MTRPADSPWNSTPNAKRHRIPAGVVITREEKAALRRIARYRGLSASRLLSQWIERELARLPADVRDADDEAMAE